MQNRTLVLSHYWIGTIVLLALIVFVQTSSALEREPNLAAKIASLDLGMNGYTLGSRLSSAQKKEAADNSTSDAYEGTYKFFDGTVYIVASRADDTILALYQRQEDADMGQARIMISGLMGLYGEPTTMAHDKIIYWTYTGEGKVSEEVYNTLRENDKTINVLATVKFNSSFDITSENIEQEQSGSIYFIISSEPLIQEFISQSK